MPCTTFSTPGGTPASAAMSASSEQVSGAHSGGFTTTVLPAASAGPTFHVVNMKRRVPRRDQRGDAGGIVSARGCHDSGDSIVSCASFMRPLGEELDVVRGARHRRARDVADRAASRCRRSRRRRCSARRARIVVREALAGSAAGPRGPSAAQAGNAARAARHRGVDLLRAAGGDVGEMGAVDRRVAPRTLAVVDGTRLPPMKWAVETSTPATRRRSSHVLGFNPVPRRLGCASRAEPVTSSTQWSTSLGGSRRRRDVRDLERARARRQVEALVQLVAAGECAADEVPGEAEQPRAFPGVEPVRAAEVAVDQRPRLGSASCGRGRRREQIVRADEREDLGDAREPLRQRGRSAANGRSSENQTPLPYSYAPASAATRIAARASSAYVQISPSICLVAGVRCR